MVTMGPSDSSPGKEAMVQMVALPTAARRLAGMVACTCVARTKVVARRVMFEPTCQPTVVPESNPSPSTATFRSRLPAGAEPGVTAVP